MVKRELINDIGLNKMWLKSKKDGFLSNIVSFTFFDFDESMSVEQVDEFSSFDNQMDPLGLQQLNEEYQKKLSSHITSDIPIPLLMMNENTLGLSILQK